MKYLEFIIRDIFPDENEYLYLMTVFSTVLNYVHSSELGKLLLFQGGPETTPAKNFIIDLFKELLCENFHIAGASLYVENIKDNYNGGRFRKYMSEKSVRFIQSKIPHNVTFHEKTFYNTNLTICFTDPNDFTIFSGQEITQVLKVISFPQRSFTYNRSNIDIMQFKEILTYYNKHYNLQNLNFPKRFQTATDRYLTHLHIPKCIKYHHLLSGYSIVNGGNVERTDLSPIFNIDIMMITIYFIIMSNDIQSYISLRSTCRFIYKICRHIEIKVPKFWINIIGELYPQHNHNVRKIQYCNIIDSSDYGKIKSFGREDNLNGVLNCLRFKFNTGVIPDVITPFGLFMMINQKLNINKISYL